MDYCTTCKHLKVLHTGVELCGLTSSQLGVEIEEVQSCRIDDDLLILDLKTGEEICIEVHGVKV